MSPALIWPGGLVSDYGSKISFVSHLSSMKSGRWKVGPATNLQVAQANRFMLPLGPVLARVAAHHWPPIFRWLGRFNRIISRRPPTSGPAQPPSRPTGSPRSGRAHLEPSCLAHFRLTRSPIKCNVTRPRFDYRALGWPEPIRLRRLSRPADRRRPGARPEFEFSISQLAG